MTGIKESCQAVWYTKRMKITKYNHSCILIEDSGKVFLIDPGMYSIGILEPQKLTQLDYILITHEHFDHFDKGLVKQLVTNFPQVKIISTGPVVDALEKEGIVATTDGDDMITVENVPHEKVWMGNPDKNIMVTLERKISHPGDSLSFTHSADILCLPLSGPWCNTTEAVELGVRLQPKVIIPIHDWHWKDEVRKGMYDRLEDYYTQQGIMFKKMENGIAVEIQ